MTKRYRVAANGTITLITDVEASSREEAIEKVCERNVQRLCHQCSGGDKNRVWSLTGEIDCDIGEDNVVDVTEL